MSARPMIWSGGFSLGVFVVLTIWIAPPSAAQDCFAPDPDHTQVELRSPVDGSIVRPRVHVSVEVVEPPGCDMTYNIKIDGTWYGSPDGDTSRLRPLGAGGTTPCSSGAGIDTWVRLTPGTHTIKVQGCHMGSAIAPINRLTTTFRVSREGTSAILPITGAGQRWVTIGIFTIAAGSLLLVRSQNSSPRSRTQASPSPSENECDS